MKKIFGCIIAMVLLSTCSPFLRTIEETDEKKAGRIMLKIAELEMQMEGASWCEAGTLLYQLESLDSRNNSLAGTFTTLNNALDRAVEEARESVILKGWEVIKREGPLNCEQLPQGTTVPEAAEMRKWLELAQDGGFEHNKKIFKRGYINKVRDYWPTKPHPETASIEEEYAWDCCGITPAELWP